MTKPIEESYPTIVIQFKVSKQRPARYGDDDCRNRHVPRRTSWNDYTRPNRECWCTLAHQRGIGWRLDERVRRFNGGSMMDEPCTRQSYFVETMTLGYYHGSNQKEQWLERASGISRMNAILLVQRWNLWLTSPNTGTLCFMNHTKIPVWHSWV